MDFIIKKTTFSSFNMKLEKNLVKPCKHIDKNLNKWLIRKLLLFSGRFYYLF